ncbi:helix-turn-helix domain-containing protein [Streptomyces albulus]|nr:helix-turn-helix domain-containing protein [Streptomyces noursei]
MDSFRPAQIGQAIARALSEAMERQGLSANALASAANVNRQVITYVLRGETWPDILTVASLEVALGEMLWPRHFDWPVDESGAAQELPPQV